MSEPTFDQELLRAFSVKPGDRGQYVVTLEGQDISRAVSGLRVDMTPSAHPHVVLQLQPSAAAHPELDLLARVVVADEPDIGAAVTRFLSAIDAEKLEQAALYRDDIQSGPQSGTKAMLAQLIEWANGRS